MKKFILFARLYTSLIFILPLQVAAQLVDHYPNYVVIGAFAHHKNAVNFTDDANKNKFPARFEMNPNRNLYYVYVLSTDDREFAMAEAVKLRGETKYFDTWVYCGALGKMVLANPGGRQDQDVDPVTGKVIEQLGSESDTEALASEQRIEHNPTLEKRIEKGDVTLADEQPSGKGNILTNGERRPRQGAGRRNKDSAQPLEGQNPENADGIGGASTEISANQPLGEDANLTDEARATEDKSASEVQRSGSREETGNDADITGPEAGRSLLNAGPASAQNQQQALVTGSDRHSTRADDQPRASGSEQNSADEKQSSLAAKQQDERELSLAPPPIRATTEPLKAEDVVDKSFYFHIFRADNGKTIGGEVDAIDFERARLMATYEGNKPVTVRMPSGKSKQVSFLCQVFGYRKQQQEFDPKSPAEDLYLDDKGNLVVPFELVRLQKGDIAIMYNVFYYKDAAVMRPESRYEVNNLLELLNENPSYKIMIHGHTNGNASGKIIYMDTPGNFYSLTGTKQGFGSAKKLSEERAIVIREFLINSGVQADRMEVKAWGGKKPIHDKHSVRAHENVRVEIEILSQ